MKGRPIGLNIILFVMPFIGLTQSAESGKWVQKAKKSFDLGKYEECYNQCSAAIAMQENNAEAYYYRGKCCFYLGRLNLEQEDYKKAILFQPDSAKYYRVLAATFEDRNDYNSALEYYKLGLKKSTTKWLEYSDLAFVYAQRGDSYNAKTYIDSAFALDKNNEDVYYARGRIRALNDQNELAKTDFLKSLEISKNQEMKMVCYIAIGRCEIALKQLTAASQHLLQAIQLNRNLADPYTQLGIIYYMQDNYSDCIEQCTKAIAIDKYAAEAYYYRGFSHSELNNLTSAKIDFESALSIKPNEERYRDALKNLGR